MPRDPWSVLGVEPSATVEEARRAYLTRAQLLHPDRHQGSSPAVLAEADRAMRELREAWEAVQRLRGQAGSGGDHASPRVVDAPTDTSGCIEWVIARMREAGTAAGEPLSSQEVAWLRLPLALAPSDRGFDRWLARRARTLHQATAADATDDDLRRQWIQVARILEDSHAGVVLVGLLTRRG